MSTAPAPDVTVAVVGAGVVGCAVALALARRGATVALLEAEPEPAYAASATNSGILHSGFDSRPGELETDLLLRSDVLRRDVLRRLQVPTLDCGAVVRARNRAEQQALGALARNAERNGIEVVAEHGSLTVPDEAVTDPVAFCLALAAAAVRSGAHLRTRFRVSAMERYGHALTLAATNGERVTARLAINCAGLYADEVARLAGDDSFTIYPRKGEFLVFAPPGGERLERILLPVPTERTKGVLVFPTVDGMVIAGPTALDSEDKHDWSVRPQAREEILPKASAMYPPLAGAEPVFAYAGLRPAGRGVNYVIEPSRGCERLVNVAAIRSTGLSAALGIGERVVELARALGMSLGAQRELEPQPPPKSTGPWWRRVAEHRRVAEPRTTA